MEDITELAPALIKAQKEFAPLAKTAINPHFKNRFVPLHELMQSVLPVLNKHGLAISQFPTTTADGDPGLCTVLMHTSGQHLHDTMPLLAAKPDPQGQGSAITYARRYAVMAVLGVVGDEDDDGEAAMKVAVRGTQDVVRTDLEVAKADLKAAIKATNADGKDFAWVKDSTDAEAIREHARALRALMKGGVIRG